MCLGLNFVILWLWLLEFVVVGFCFAGIALAMVLNYVNFGRILEKHSNNAENRRPEFLSSYLQSWLYYFMANSSLLWSNLSLLIFAGDGGHGGSGGHMSDESGASTSGETSYVTYVEQGSGDHSSIFVAAAATATASANGQTM